MQFFAIILRALRRGSAWRLFALLPLLLCTGCSAVDIVNALTTREGYRIVKDSATATARVERSTSMCRTTWPTRRRW